MPLIKRIVVQRLIGPKGFEKIDIRSMKKRLRVMTAVVVGIEVLGIKEDTLGQLMKKSNLKNHITNSQDYTHMITKNLFSTKTNPKTTKTGKNN